MDRRMNELLSVYSETEREVSNLETEFNHLESKKKKLQQFVACHIAKICPQYSKRDNSSLLDPDKKSIEKIFINQEELCRDILGYSFVINHSSFEEQEAKLVKRWEVEGKVGESSFIVKFTTETGISKDSERYKDTSPPVSIQSLEIFPSSDDMNNLSEHLMRLNHLKLLVPCLYFYQILYKKRSDVAEKLSGFREVTITEENDTLKINVQLENLKFSICWNIVFGERSYKYSDYINIETEEIDALEGHECLPYLLREKYLKTSEEVTDFFESLFHMS
ncbi:hypothetical protein Avbf_00571 [Armadillidium vulgare]|nr:hypothetical protein Avbf_00571 [Armadillidium vulgare]